MSAGGAGPFLAKSRDMNGNISRASWGGAIAQPHSRFIVAREIREQNIWQKKSSRACHFSFFKQLSSVV